MVKPAILADRLQTVATYTRDEDLDHAVSHNELGDKADCDVEFGGWRHEGAKGWVGTVSFVCVYT
mgnify:CR=1 FL=1